MWRHLLSTEPLRVNVGGIFSDVVAGASASNDQAQTVMVVAGDHHDDHDGS